MLRLSFHDCTGDNGCALPATQVMDGSMSMGTITMPICIIFPPSSHPPSSTLHPPSNAGSACPQMRWLPGHAAARQLWPGCRD
jgi:hypothetical protein